MFLWILMQNDYAVWAHQSTVCHNVVLGLTAAIACHISHYDCRERVPAASVLNLEWQMNFCSWRTPIVLGSPLQKTRSWPAEQWIHDLPLILILRKITCNYFLSKLLMDTKTGLLLSCDHPLQAEWFANSLLVWQIWLWAVSGLVCT